MKHSIRLVAEYYNQETGKIIESKILYNDKVKRPVTINDLGFLHSEQIELLQSIQDFGF